MVMWRWRTLDYANPGKTRKTYLALLNWGRGRISQTISLLGPAIWFLL